MGNASEVRRLAATRAAASRVGRGRARADVTIGADLEQRRLAHRAVRLQRALEALRDRAVYRRASDGQVPTPLRDAIADFSSQLNAIEHRLDSHSTAQRRSGR